MFYRVLNKRSRTADDVLHPRFYSELFTSKSSPYIQPRINAQPMGRGHKQWRADMKCGTFNVRCQCKPGLVKFVATELARYKLDLAVVEAIQIELGGR
jgi:hypothetical protein